MKTHTGITTLSLILGAICFADAPAPKLFGTKIDASRSSEMRGVGSSQNQGQNQNQNQQNQGGFGQMNPMTGQINMGKGYESRGAEIQEQFSSSFKTIQEQAKAGQEELTKSTQQASEDQLKKLSEISKEGQTAAAKQSEELLNKLSEQMKSAQGIAASGASGQAMAEIIAAQGNSQIQALLSQAQLAQLQQQVAVGTVPGATTLADRLGTAGAPVGPGLYQAGLGILAEKAIENPGSVPQTLDIHGNSQKSGHYGHDHGGGDAGHGHSHGIGVPRRDISSSLNLRDESVEISPSTQQETYNFPRDLFPQN